MSVSRHPGSASSLAVYTHSRRATARQAGFTLLEVLVALTLLGFILVIAFGAMRFGMRSWEATVLRAGEADQLRSVQHFLRGQLSSLVPMRLGETRKVKLAFRGEADAMHFIAPLSHQRGPVGLQEVLFSSEQDARGERLVMRYRQFDPEQQELQGMHGGLRAQQVTEVVLLDSLQHIEFDYFGIQRDGQAARWTGDWPQESSLLPTLIRIRLAPKDARQPWPDVLVPLHAELRS